MIVKYVVFQNLVAMFVVFLAPDRDKKILGFAIPY
jgi:hypothetical protein